MKQNNAPPVLYCCYCTYSNVSSRVPGGLGPDHFILGSGSRTMQGSLDLTFPHIFLFSAVPHYSGTNFIAVLTALRIRIVKETSAVIPVTMETRCFHKKLEFQRHPPKDFCTARYEHKSSKKNPGPILGQDRPEKTAKYFLEATRFRVLDRHRSTKLTTAA